MTETNYQAALERIGEQRPGHPLLDTLRKGMNALNIKRVIAILQELATAPVPEAEDMDDEDLQGAVMPAADDPELRQLYIQKSNLFVLRAKHSNRLHDCRTDRERSAVIDDILEVQREIEDHFERIRTYKATGVVTEEGDGYRIPTDGAELMKLQNSLRVLISRKKKEIEALYHETQTAPIVGKTLNCEAKLKHYELHLSHVKREIERRRPGGVHE